MPALDPSSHVQRRRAAQSRRRRRRVLLGLLAVAAVAVGAFLLLRGGGDDGAPSTNEVRAARLVPGSADGQGIDPLRYTSARRADFEARAAAGNAHVLYAKVPGGAVATAARVDALRPKIEAATEGTDVDPDVLEAIVLLESGGRPDAQASNDLNGAAGLTQILAETGRDLLGMKIDVARSTKLTKQINKGGKRTAARVRLRRQVDERFDAEKSLAATVKYLEIAKDKLGSEEKAIAAYHMGIGNLQTALKKYGEGSDIPYAELYFGSTPLDKADAYTFLAGLGDDSSTYLWRIRAAQEIMRLHREDPDELATQADLQTRKNSAEDLLRPEADTKVFADPGEIKDAIAGGDLVRLSPKALAEDGLRIDTGMGSLAPRFGESKRTYRALTPDALAVLSYIGAGVQGIAGVGPLTVTSSVRDEPYQRALASTNIEATHAYSLHTTGNAFDLSRAYKDPKQGPALQFLLDRLVALDIISWVREPAAIHVTAGPRAKELLPLLRRTAPDAAPTATTTTAR
jgi:hypothetical protein